MFVSMLSDNSIVSLTVILSNDKARCVRGQDTTAYLHLMLVWCSCCYPYTIQSYIINNITSSPSITGAIFTLHYLRVQRNGNRKLFVKINLRPLFPVLSYFLVVLASGVQNFFLKFLDPLMHNTCQRHCRHFVLMMIFLSNVGFHTELLFRYGFKYGEFSRSEYLPRDIFIV